MFDCITVESASGRKLFKARVAQPLPVPGQLHAFTFPWAAGEASLLYGLPPLVDQIATLTFIAGADFAKSSLQVLAAGFIV